MARYALARGTRTFDKARRIAGGNGRDRRAEMAARWATAWLLRTRHGWPYEAIATLISQDSKTVQNAVRRSSEALAGTPLRSGHGPLVKKIVAELEAQS